MKRNGWIVLSALAAIVAAYFLAVKSNGTSEPLLVYCGAGIKEPVEAAAKEFELESGRAVMLQFGASQTLLAQAEVSRQGSLYLPGDESFVELAREKGLVTRSLPLASLAPVLAVKKGNPKSIRTIEDLSRADVRLGQVNPDSAAAGKLVRAALQKSGHWAGVADRTTVFAGTVNEVAAALRLGSVDAGFIWDVLVLPFQDLEIVPIPELSGVKAHVTAGLLKSGEADEAAWRFAEYLASPAGDDFFKRSGFSGAP